MPLPAQLYPAVPAQVAEKRLHLLLPVVAMASESGHLPSLLLQPLCDLRLLLRWDLLASSLELIFQLIQASVCILGLQESLINVRQFELLTINQQADGSTETTSTCRLVKEGIQN